MITFLVLLLVALFVILCIPTKEINPDRLAVRLKDYGYELKASQPDADGLCTFKLIDSDGDEVAHTDEPGTGEDALKMARKFITDTESW
jgi:hypothetical protein